MYELFAYWLNLSDSPSRYFCQILGTFLMKLETTSNDETLKKKADKLLEFASKTAEGKSEYFRYAVRERRSCYELFKDFDVNT